MVRNFCKENKIETSFTKKGRTCKNEVKNATKRESHSDGRLICNSEGILRTSKYSYEDKVNRDRADLLWHPHCECGKPIKTRVCTSSPRSLIFHAWNPVLREWRLLM